MTRSGGAPRWLALAGATVLVVLGVAVVAVAPPARAAGSPPGVSPGTPSVALLGQSPFVASGQSFHLQLAITAPDASARVEVAIDQRLTTRTDFDTAVKGKVHSSAADVVGPMAVSSLPTDPAGGVDVNVPVNASSGSGFVTSEDSGVYPVQVQLFNDDGDPTGTPLTTFLVYVSPAAVNALTPGQSQSSFPRLGVALTVPVQQPPALTRSGQTTRLPAAASSSLASLAATLQAHSSVPLTLAATPQTLDTLAGGSGIDRSTLASLASLVAGGRDEVAGATYADASLPSLVAAGMDSEVATQISSGSATLTADLHGSPTAGIWTVNGPLDQTTLGSLTAAGVNELVVPSGDLSALPAEDDQTTLAAPTELSTAHGDRLKVINIDPVLADHFTNGGNQVLAANQLLAELAMIQLETPGETRGVAVVPPAGWQVNSTFLSILLSGLAANPLLAPETTSSLLSSVPVLGSSSPDPLVRTLTASRPTVAAYPDALQVRAARAAVDAVGSIFPGDRARLVDLQRLVLTSEAQGLSVPQRRLITGAVSASLTQLRQEISLPGASSITLTARNGGVPITVVSNGAAGARVQLRLSSEKLAFKAFNPPEGQCTTPQGGVEVCQLTLSNEATTLKVPVVARASGVFTLQVLLSSPDGAVPLSASRDTVRSTAFSGVGVVLIVVAALALAYWWVRNIRHGRRARDLVPADVDEADLAEAVHSDGAPRIVVSRSSSPASPSAPPPSLSPSPPPPSLTSDANDGADAAGIADGGTEDEATWMDEDPVIAEFFATPAPVYPPPASGPLRGSRS